MAPGPRRRPAAIALGSAACAFAWPLLGWATSQCPPHPGGRSWAATALVWALLLGFGLAGPMLPIAGFRASAGLRWPRRALIVSLALLGMLAVWLLGLWIFFDVFVMTCVSF